MQMLIAGAWILVGLVASLGSFFVPHIPAAVLSFYFFPAWLLWIWCLLLKPFRGKLSALIGLWLILDLSILLSFLSAASMLGDIERSQGAEIVWGIAYLPSILPFGLMVNVLHDSFRLIFAALNNACVEYLGAAYGHVTGTWIGLSLVSIWQCSVLALLVWCCRQAVRLLQAAPGN